MADPFAYALQSWPWRNDYGGDFGIARDGHVIVGPYNAQGELWDCTQLDVCHGTFLADGSYVYVPTATFPHLIGCWGPAPVNNHRVSTRCSALTCAAGTDNGASVLATAAAGIMALAVSMVF